MVSQLKEFNNIPALIATLDHAQEQWMEHMGQAIVDQVQQGFDTGEDALGRPWEPIREGGQPLVDTGYMRDSMSYRVTDDGVMVGSDAEYIEYHERGTGTIPARPVLAPAAIWAEKNLIAKSADEKIGGTVDALTRKQVLA